MHSINSQFKLALFDPIGCTGGAWCFPHSQKATIPMFGMGIMLHGQKNNHPQEQAQVFQDKLHTASG